MKYKLTFLLLLLGLASCKPPKTIPYETLLSGLTNLNSIAQLDVPATQMICSYDRTGANEDYNHFLGTTKNGECILADLKGPGIVTRFWFTGIKADKHFRLYFDGEKDHRFEFSWDDLRSGVTPFDTPPVSIDDQNCWYTFFPIPFKKSLLITTEDAGYSYGGSPKMYYQINWHPLPPGQTVQSLTSPLAPAAKAELEKVARRWEQMDFGPLPPADHEFIIPSQQVVELWNGKGPASIRAFAINSPTHDPTVLRNVLLKVYWDGHADPSVCVPLGDFFGSVWQRWRGQSMFFGSTADTFFCRFPMPFQKSVRFVLHNESDTPITLGFGVETGPLINGGYFHAGWRNSGAAETGTPHAVLKTTGKGRYAGCILSVVSADRSFWVLESDETMMCDGKTTWHGTGLEDYFNSGWYYENVFARPLHGLPNKAPFRTVQYRVHLTEPVLFDKTFNMVFERGPGQASHAAYESVSFYYLEQPQGADGRLTKRTPPHDAMQQYTLMTDLWNYERLDDLQGAADYIDRYCQQFRPTFKEVLDLRKLAYQYESGQLSHTDFGSALNTSTNSYAGAMRALYMNENEDSALIQLYCNMPSELYLDGQLILRGGDPKLPVSRIVSLPKGRHVLAAVSSWQQYPKWTQVAVRNAEGYLVGTSQDWSHAINPSGNWAAVDYDASTWQTLRNYDGRVKGPPEEPYIWVNPDPFLNTLSQAAGLRPSAPWDHHKGRVVYRKVFEVE